MEKKQILMIAQVLLIALGILMIYLGAMFGAKVMYPPIVTGVGFFIIAWAFQSLK